MSDLLSPQNALICPRGKNNESFCLDMTQVYVAENRIKEVAFVTPHKAPELLVIFNEGFLELTRYITQLKYELTQAKATANKVKSVVMLDKVPQILESKGLTGKSSYGSADLREAILESDEDYILACDKVAQITAMVELLKGKLDSLEMAFSSVKKIIGENVYNMTNTRLRADGSKDEEVTISNNQKMFGKPRY